MIIGTVDTYIFQSFDFSKVGKIMAAKYGRFHMYGRYQGHKQ